jgi:ATP-dependent DNA helicase RecG
MGNSTSDRFYSGSWQMGTGSELENARPGKGSPPAASPLHLSYPVESLGGIGPSRAAQLGNLGIETVDDLLHHFPREYQDRRRVTPIGAVGKGDSVTVQGVVVSSRMVRLRGRMNLAEVMIEDATGSMKAIWFGRGFLAKSFTEGKSVLLTGDVSTHKGLALRNPDYEWLDSDGDDVLSTGRIVPVYRLTEKVTQRMMRKWIHEALTAAQGVVVESLPEEIRERNGLSAKPFALHSVHFPDTLEQADEARERFAYEELLGIQLGVLTQRAHREQDETGVRHEIDGDGLRTLQASLPFELTDGQQRTVQEILADMACPSPMCRLLQGDVGSGKTAVAMLAAAAALDGGFQVAFMAPTELLAVQHYRTVSAFFVRSGIDVLLATSSTTNSEMLGDISTGHARMVVGTHALFQKQVSFRQLGLVIIDEQHRFGVGQREELAGKGIFPDVLQMTATPIPRTLTMTLYGHMDVSIIPEKPANRKPVITRRITPAKIADMYEYVVKQARLGYQTYIVCPLVEESETRKLKNVEDHFDELSQAPLASVRTGMVHGRMPPDEKRDVMASLQRGDLDVLFSTSVIEVGVDVPRATTMIIEDAAQFGLTQLHQLRGRVGRGSEQSHCFLLGKPATPEGKRRLEILCETDDGFELAEEDFRMRGPGEVYGMRQAGASDLRAADLTGDLRLVDLARRDAEALLDGNPMLQGEEYTALRKLRDQYRGDMQ